MWYKPGQTKDFVATLKRINAEAAKLVTGLPRSTSGAAAEVETNLRPTHLRQAHRLHNAATCLLSAPQEYPLHQKFLEAAALTFPRRQGRATHVTPLDQLAHAFPDLRNNDGHLVVYETIQLVDSSPPWDEFEPLETSIAESKDDAAQKDDHDQLIASLEPKDVVASIKLQWVPGHVEIDGNELADEAAKEATKATDDESIKQGLEIERPNTIPASRTAHPVRPISSCTTGSHVGHRPSSPNSVHGGHHSRMTCSGADSIQPGFADAARRRLWSTSFPGRHSTLHLERGSILTPDCILCLDRRVPGVRGSTGQGDEP